MPPLASVTADQVSEAVVLVLDGEVKLPGVGGGVVSVGAALLTLTVTEETVLLLAEESVAMA